MKSFVYCITCLVNDKCYIGKTNNPDRRWHDHCEPKASNAGGMLIHRAIKKHGPENFKFEVIAECDSEDEAFEAEHRLIIERGTSDLTKGYNLNEGGRGGRNPSELVRQKIGAKHRGKKISDEQKAMISARHKGKVVSEESRRKMSESRSGEGNGRYRMPVSEETMTRISKGVKASWARRKAAREAHT